MIQARSKRMLPLMLTTGFTPDTGAEERLQPCAENCGSFHKLSSSWTDVRSTRRAAKVTTTLHSYPRPFSACQSSIPLSEYTTIAAYISDLLTQPATLPLAALPHAKP